MDKKKLNTHIRKELKRMGKDLKREKARCARLYPDWRDDEYNMLDNYFIWGFNKNPKVIPSFNTWDDLYIYFNRASGKYYYHFDTGIYRYEDMEAARIELERLSEMEIAFRNFIVESGLTMRANFCAADFEDEGAATLSGLYVKFRTKYEAYKWYVENKPQI